ncbi:MAG: stress response translation initiation inhibitor YciH [Acidobacteria bacterium]|nr:stress response translation initiation inhibitor YciH [Acidobacteriota bacterium]
MARGGRIIPPVPPASPRLVFSSDSGRVCPDCGRPKDVCSCKAKIEAQVPGKITAKLRLEKKGRGGKSVTVIDGLPNNEAFLEDLAKELKKACGSGGAVKDGTVEIQGDHREKLRVLLSSKGYTVKG